MEKAIVGGWWWDSRTEILGLKTGRNVDPLHLSRFAIFLTDAPHVMQ